MRIFFQNPTKGPLITVSFDAGDGASLAFVPAAMDCAAKAGTVATGGAVSAPVVAISAVVGGLVPGDSSPHHLQGINRFATLATATVTPDGVPANSDATPAGPAAVGLPGDATLTATADVNPLDSLADVLKTWDGVSSLEISGFKFEKVADSDGKPTIKITITTDNVQDIINVAHAVQTTFPEESHRITVDVTHPNLGRALLRWGHRYFDRIIAEIVASRPQILAMNEKLLRGEALSEDERTCVTTLFNHLTDCLNTFARHKDILNGFLVGSQDWAGFLHDMSKRDQELNIILDICEILSNREPIDEELTGYLNSAGQLSILYAVEFALALVKEDIQKNKIQLAWHFNINKNIPLANEDEFDTLVDILANLISNAARYSDPRKETREVHITIRHTDGGLEIEVRDNGIGIPADKLQDIGQFEFRVGEKPVDGSHGHGLWQTQKNLDDLGWGKLHVESTHGEGSRFWFIISNRD